MARAAFVVDRADGPRSGSRAARSCRCSRPTRARCPGIMATRTIPSPRDRLVTILVAPLMTCSARLPGLRAADRRLRAGACRCRGRSASRASCCSALYLLGARRRRSSPRRCSKRTLLPRRRRCPSTSSCRPTACRRCAAAGSRRCGAARARSCAAPARSSSPSSIVLWVLLHVPAQPSRRRARRPPRRARHALEHSFAGRIGHAIEPAIAPLGFDWKIGVGLIASLAAREVIVATLAQIYAVGRRGRRLAARRAPRRRRPAHGPARLHAADGRLAARVLRVRAAVHLDARGDARARPTPGAGRPSRSATCSRSPTAASFATHRIVGAPCTSSATRVCRSLLGACAPRERGLLGTRRATRRRSARRRHHDRWCCAPSCATASRSTAASAIRSRSRGVRARAHARAHRRARGLGRATSRASAGRRSPPSSSTRSASGSRGAFAKADPSQEVVVQALRREQPARPLHAATSSPASSRSWATTISCTSSSRASTGPCRRAKKRSCASPARGAR